MPIGNHLGNVLTTISDKKFGVSSGAIGAPINYYDPEIVSATDYYPFGMVSRVATSSTGKDYRFGFNGKENDNGVKGFGNQQDYGLRIYDPRIGRFLSVDPLTKDFPWYTPYQYAGNTPIQATDLDGAEPRPYHTKKFWGAFGRSVLRGIGKGLSYIANNPNHAGYGLNHNNKPPTMEDVKRYEINWRQQLDPKWQAENFSNSLVYGTTNFIGGIIEGDGERTAQAIPQLLGAIGTIEGLASFFKIPQISFVSNFAGRAQLKLGEYASELLGKAGKKPYIISAVTDMKTGKTYTGKNAVIESINDVDPVLRSKLPEETLEKWKTYNCAECDPFNKALKNGAKWEDLGDMHTMRYDKKQGKYVPMERCDNCKVTYKDKNPTSEQ